MSGARVSVGAKLFIHNIKKCFASTELEFNPIFRYTLTKKPRQLTQPKTIN
jgi:hypothetical protein